MRWALPQRREACVYLFIVLTISAGLWISCGGSSTSSTPSPHPPAGPTPSPSPVPSPSPTPSSAASYLYVGVSADQGGVQGFRVDSRTGALAEVPGSPLLFGPAVNSFSQAGAIAAAKGHVFVGFGPPGFQSPVIRSYTVDASTGSLGNFVETTAGAVGGDEQVRALVTDPAARNLYAVYQYNIASFQINGDGSLTYLGTLTNLATAFVFALTIDPAANLAFLGVDNCPPKGSCGGPPDILLLSRDPNSGILSNTHKLMGQNNVVSPGALGIDPSGNHLVAWTADANGNAQFSVFNVDSTGSLSPAAGSPYPAAGGLP